VDCGGACSAEEIGEELVVPQGLQLQEARV
jgi:hypothetical protein